MRSLLPRVASLRAVAVTALIVALCCGVARAAKVSLTTPTLTIDVGKNATGTSGAKAILMNTPTLIVDVGKNATGTSGAKAQVSLTTPQLVITVSK